VVDFAHETSCWQVVPTEVAVPVEKVVFQDVVKEVQKVVTQEVPVEVQKVVTREVPFEVQKVVTNEIAVEVEKLVKHEVPIEIERVIRSDNVISENMQEERAYMQRSAGTWRSGLVSFAYSFDENTLPGKEVFSGSELLLNILRLKQH
jgi:hypothetical protein